MPRQRYIEFFRGGKLGRGLWYHRAVAGNGHMLDRSKVFRTFDQAKTDAEYSYPGWPHKILKGPAKPRKRATKEERAEFFSTLA